MRLFLIILAAVTVIGGGYFAYRYTYSPPFPCHQGETVGLCLVKELQRIRSNNASTYRTVLATSMFGDSRAIETLTKTLNEHSRNYDEEAWHQYHLQLYQAMLEAAAGNVPKSIATVQAMAADKTLPDWGTRNTQKRVVKILLAQNKPEEAAQFLEGTQNASFIPEGKENVIQKDLNLGDGPLPIVYGAFKLNGDDAHAEKFLASIKQQSVFFMQIGDRNVKNYFAAHEKNIKAELERLQKRRHHKVPAEVIDWALKGETDKVVAYVSDLSAVGDKKYLASQAIIRELIYHSSKNIDLFQALWGNQMGQCLRQGAQSCFGGPDHDMFIDERRYGDCLQGMIF
ncbi:MAG: hypothetical protein ACAH80_11950 [Alphaproteobacteria bacterium]